MKSGVFPMSLLSRVMTSDAIASMLGGEKSKEVLPPFNHILECTNFHFSGAIVAKMILDLKVMVLEQIRNILLDDT